MKTKWPTPTKLNQPTKKTNIIRSFPVFKNLKLWLILSFILVVIICIFSPINIIFDQQFILTILQKYPSYSVIFFIFGYIILTVIGIPGTVLTIAGGILFGIFWGTFWSVIGASLGALGAFLTARYLLRDYVQKKFGHHQLLANFQQAVLRQPIKFVLAVRFAPISPFNVVNFLFGLTPINWLTYTLGTFVGIIPGTLVYTWLGVSGTNAVQGSDRLSFFVALGFLCLLSILPMIARQNQPKSSS
ncbi:TVP38/TMEM64 family protein [Aphanothece sacrum]|uniref:TVP38/TMEM64 family membrane protein n=1 Tax=Aphanothece sacrum FPU1 TaxID=1920663 RepID=A0A401IDW6_APHSA|nr:TVP38/TMEM64 family protein [Aphanothece sacrum]GBF79465.1 pyridine nucleotide-disulfide oxidoreductase [Aphanothece sacrum FPU1]GBF85813.1 pyridine nucleotide-disulfide oxidoreductase [Aphanothece sacrum FPU3]